ncbi:Rpn family recombination-promoting nuclease/putative transposase [Aetokthonos hydrillicola Thurmond2011]|jgi:predicted transposase/invertase (TIGR01784 family)|uniref:Rpn family recombination-promoting nuclease/putative transposase n=1 Tax=Aetokthonos hydrillicola Thurmond2011 TaxID=2712845 RepID=A0AAP5IG37_9CYAN|nr:Rpn family recombination-promoting nuclease/putative transposase [Aetokthonos hydrillicola]MBO3461910.1 Rpn family recombination-promoting nuclease/putative transposase [Aetokthonos hydrillicola CCALA 1050]MBW4585425.1 Rpn family recombination-promoting nuclease/putative transposase [Aetokthonos hydrillicola CCALA 1050]MDR9899068.1 Rpn family recombination-promoting nuclease/putative transposase [Aetokthonos hydrillicola Thurmond2011]
MRRDSIFYKLFQQSPSLLFELLTERPENANDYRFDCVAVKEPKFEIDGVFLPPENEGAGVVYFCEVQFQKDQQLYERVFAESSLYFYRNRARFSDWQAVIIYPTRSIEQSDIHPHRSLLNGDQLHRVYLDELGDIRQLPLWVALMVLTTVEESKAPEEARYLLSRTRQEVPSSSSRGIIEILTAIMVYKFQGLSRAEVESMLGITLQETRVYREIKEEGREEGRQLEAAQLIIRQISKRIGQKLSEEMQEQISGLPLSVLEDLSEALLDFTTLADLQAWLEDKH